MHFNQQENNLLFSETFNCIENNASYNEFPQTDTENSCFQEKTAIDEICNGADTKNKESKNVNTPSVSHFSKYLSIIAVTVVTGTAIILPTTPTVKPFKLKSEDVSYNSYKCVLIDDTLASIDVAITGDNGEKYQITLENQEGEYALFLDSLYPDTNYSVTAVDKDGKTRYQDTFTTQPFMTVTSQDDFATYFSLHPDISLNSDFTYTLKTSDGLDFTSNVMLDTTTDTPSWYIVNNGLYQDDYDFTFQLHLSENKLPLTYAKILSLGNLEAIDFSVTYQYYGETTDVTGQIDAVYRSGDISVYAVTEITLINLTTDDYYSFTDFTVNENTGDLSLPITQVLPEGNYAIAFWGICEFDNYSLSNQLWQTVINITNA